MARPALRGDTAGWKEVRTFLEADVARWKGVRWLKANQRDSGRWFTRSLNNDKAHDITNAGTAFAVLALEACGEAVAGK